MQSLKVSLSSVNLFFNFLQLSGVSSKYLLDKEKKRYWVRIQIKRIGNYDVQRKKKTNKYVRVWHKNRPRRKVYH